MKHQRVQRGSLFTGIAAATWLSCGVALVLLTKSWWSYLFIGVGVVVATAFLVLLPRYRRARLQLEHIERLRVEQEDAAKRQLAARMQAFSQPPIRAPFPSR
jgi:hypothetical protein